MDGNSEGLGGRWGHQDKGQRVRGPLSHWPGPGRASVEVSGRLLLCTALLSAPAARQSQVPSPCPEHTDTQAARSHSPEHVVSREEGREDTEERR